MKTICVSASLRYKEFVRETLEKFAHIKVDALFPNLDSAPSEEDIDLETMRKLERDHFGAIDRSEALYVVNPDGYIGTLVKVEIGYALGRGKPVYYSEKTNDLELDALAMDFVPLESIGRFLAL